MRKYTLFIIRNICYKIYNHQNFKQKLKGVYTENKHFNSIFKGVKIQYYWAVKQLHRNIKQKP